jgi:hypothetical protein
VIHPHPSDRITIRAAFMRGLLIGFAVGFCAALAVGMW